MFAAPGAALGYAAGVATSGLWTATSLLFTAAGRRIGPTAVNATRLAVAILLLGVSHRALAGTWLPPASAGQVALLALSGLVGLCLGDQALFVAFVDIGPRLAMLIMTTAPLLATGFGWLALGETLPPTACLGVALTVGGVAWVVVERPDPTGAPTPRRARGVGLAFLAAACQAGGLLLSKQGIGHGWLPREAHLDPQAATLIRVFFAGLAMAPVMVLYARRERKQRAAGLRGPRSGRRSTGLLLTLAGAVVGPYLGIWMSLVAADLAPVGIAQTLCSLPPVFILPFSRLVHQERVTWRAVLGALVAVSGVGVLFLVAP